MAVADRIKNMSVAWFSFNLATSAIILSSFAVYAVTKTSWLLDLSRSLAYVNTAIFVVIAAMFIARLVLNPRGTLAMFVNPIQGPFTATISIAIMLLSLDWSIVLHSVSVAEAFFYTGLVLHTLITIVSLISLFLHPGIEVAMMNPGWYMPAVGNLLVPYIGSLLVHEGVQLPLTLLGAYLGTGVMFWVALFAVWVYRSIFHHPPPARMLGTAWINLAPPSVIPLAYEALLGFTPPEYRRLLQEIGAAAQSHGAAAASALLVKALYGFIYYTFWGLNLFLLAIVAGMTIIYIVRGKAEFAESWWALVFPQAAYTIATIHLYMHTPETWLYWLALLLYASTIVSYIVVSLLSLYYGLLELKGRQPPPPLRPLEK